MIRRIAAGTRALIAAIVGPAFGASAIRVDAPPALAVPAAVVREFDTGALAADLARAGLALPPEIEVTLVPEDDARAKAIPAWVVGFASGSRHIVMFPERVLSYPYDSLESVLRHEVAHLALFERAGGASLPRWFHEGVAVSVDAGWDFSSRLQLLLAMRRDPGLPSLARLYATGNQPDSSLAYRLSAALVADLRRRYGGAVPGAIANRVAEGQSFERAFALETGHTPEEAAARAWAGYRRWTAWVGALTSDAMPWAVILALAFLAFAVRVRQRTRRRLAWDEDDDGAVTAPRD